MKGAEWIEDRFDKMEAESLQFFDGYGDWTVPPIPTYEVLGDVGKALKAESEAAEEQKLETERVEKLKKKLVCSSDGFDCLR